MKASSSLMASRYGERWRADFGGDLFTDPGEVSEVERAEN
jgi:hypothetical protein